MTTPEEASESIVGDAPVVRAPEENSLAELRRRYDELTEQINNHLNLLEGR